MRNATRWGSAVTEKQLRLFSVTWMVTPLTLVLMCAIDPRENDLVVDECDPLIAGHLGPSEACHCEANRWLCDVAGAGDGDGDQGAYVQCVATCRCVFVLGDRTHTAGPLCEADP